MATYGDNVTYMDLASRLDENDKVARIIEMQAQTNKILDDLITIECNMVAGHKSTIRTGLPSVAWRMLNYGVPKSKSTTAQVIDTCGMLEAYAEIDKDLAKINGNTAAFRLSEDRAFLEAMNQTMAAAIFYGNQQVDQEKITGLAPRFSKISTDENEAGFNIINAYASASGADQTSIWLVVWGENTVHAIYPKGTVAGYEHQDLGEVTASDTAGGMYQVLRTHYKWDIGLCVRDWRYVVRIANIDMSAINTTTVDLFAALTDAYYRIPGLEVGRAAFYMNPQLLAWFHKQAAAKTNVLQTTKDPAGRPVVDFLGIPLRSCKQILLTESVVS